MIVKDERRFGIEYYDEFHGKYSHHYYHVACLAEHEKHRLKFSSGLSLEVEIERLAEEERVHAQTLQKRSELCYELLALRSLKTSST